MSRTPTIGVLALQGAVAEHERALKAAGAHTVKVRRAAELQGLDGLIIPGGESTAIARLAAPVGLMPPSGSATTRAWPSSAPARA